MIRPSYLRVKPVFLNLGRMPRKRNSNNFGKQLENAFVIDIIIIIIKKKWLTIVIDVGEALKWDMTQKSWEILDEMRITCGIL